jgi:hypothetical protein
MRYRLTFMTGVALGYVLGAKAGRERYEQIVQKARQVTQNPAVRNTAETAAQQGRQVAGKAYHTVSDKMPDSMTQRVKSVRGSRAGSNGGGVQAVPVPQSSVPPPFEPARLPRTDFTRWVIESGILSLTVW